MLSRKLMERFTKDYKIPIKVYDEIDFMHRIKLYDPFYHTIEKWNQFYNIVTAYPNEEEYLAEFNRVKDEAIDFIKESEGYIAFTNLDMNVFAVKNKNLPGKDIFHPSNIGRTFISIDMKKANFNSLRYYDSGIFDEKDTWEDFIRNFTDNECIINSKHTREVILGNCACKRHITFEKHLMDNLLTEMLNAISEENINVSIDQIVFFSNDEIIFDITGMFSDDVKKLRDMIERIVDASPLPFRIEKFYLRGIRRNDTTIIGYIRELESGEMDFKCLSAMNVPFVIKTLLNKPIDENDRIFEYEGQRAMLIDTPKIEII